jgi:hypothetical protein
VKYKADAEHLSVVRDVVCHFLRIACTVLLNYAVMQYTQVVVLLYSSYDSLDHTMSQ